MTTRFQMLCLAALPAVFIALWQLLPNDYCTEVVTISDNQCTLKSSDIVTKWHHNHSPTVSQYPDLHCKCIKSGLTFTSFCCPCRSGPSTLTTPTTACRTAGRCRPPQSPRRQSSPWAPGPARFKIHWLSDIMTTEDIGYYDYRPVTLLFACFISFQGYALS